MRQYLDCQPHKMNLVHFAKEDGLLELKGDANKAGPAIEKYLAPFRKILGESDPRFLDINFGSDWCAAYVYYLVVKSGFDLAIKPFLERNGTFGCVGIWFEWAVLHNVFRKLNYQPEPGDLVLYDKLLSDSELDHIGIVLENHKGYLITSEGNINNSSGIFKRQKDTKIRGYIKIYP